MRQRCHPSPHQRDRSTIPNGTPKTPNTPAATNTEKNEKVVDSTEFARHSPHKSCHPLKTATGSSLPNRILRTFQAPEIPRAEDSEGFRFQAKVLGRSRGQRSVVGNIEKSHADIARAFRHARSPQRVHRRHGRFARCHNESI